MVNVSVIIPTYGNPDYLEKSICSVLNQTLEKIELIVVDDNNPDSEGRKKTEEIISRYQKHVVYLKHDKNKNGAAARNTGIAVASGKYIAFLDSDDVYDINRLKVCYDTLEVEGGRYGAVYTGCSFYRNNKHYKDYCNITSGNFLVETLACEFAFCTGSNIFMRADIVRELNGFDETFIRHQDYEFLVRFFENHDIIAIPQVYVRKNDEFRNLPNIQKIISVKEKYLQKYNHIIRGLSKKDQNHIYYAQYYQIAQLALESKEFDVYKQYRTYLDKIPVLDLKAKMKLNIMYLRGLISR